MDIICSIKFLFCYVILSFLNYPYLKIKRKSSIYNKKLSLYNYKYTNMNGFKFIYNKDYMEIWRWDGQHSLQLIISCRINLFFFFDRSCRINWKSEKLKTMLLHIGTRWGRKAYAKSSEVLLPSGSKTLNFSTFKNSSSKCINRSKEEQHSFECYNDPFWLFFFLQRDRHKHVLLCN